MSAIIIGGISGVLVVMSAVTLDKFKLDDCVGAVSVHLVCGIFGTLAVGIFGEMAGWSQLWIQAKGVLIYGAFSFGSAFIIFKAIDLTFGLRVSAEHEKGGMDSHEHGIRGYTIVYNE
jgi:Amt family ammonium transporter